MAVTTTQALAALETLYHDQVDAKPWKPVTPYDIKARREAEGPQPQLIVDTFTPEHVLDYGCGYGLLVAFLAELGVNVHGYEPNLDLAKVPPYVRHLVTTQKPQPGMADLVICREVLEHVPLRQIRGVVSHLCALSSQFVYVTTRFNEQPQAHLLEVQTADALDPTHITMLTKEFLRLLFVLEGFVARPDLEAKLDWKRVGRALVYERV